MKKLLFTLVMIALSGIIFSAQALAGTFCLLYTSDAADDEYNVWWWVGGG